MEVGLRRLFRLAAACADRYGGDLRLGGGAAAALVSALLALSTAGQTSTDTIVAHTLAQSQAYDITAHLADRIGPRLSGSRNAELAVQWTTGRFRAWGIPVRNEPVIVPHWVRGAERARLVSHHDQNIVLTTLGGSVATPAAGITADVVQAATFEDLGRLGRKAIAGKIVLFTAAMDINLVRSGEAFAAYSKAAGFRSKGPDAASEYGAVAALVRSVGSASLRTPHTGALRYRGKQKPIPAAAVSAEDALLIQRLLDGGERVRMHLTLTPRLLPEVESANVVAEIRGRETPEEIVLIGGHLDSWDLGTGAIDNAAGVAMVMDTMRAIKALGLQPRRTIRAVLYMNEENGLRGAKSYARDHASELGRHVAAVESDAGATEPIAFRTTLDEVSRDAFTARFTGPLSRVAKMSFFTSEYAGADTSPLVDAGVPAFGLVTESLHYFDYHHTAADTLDKIDRDELTRATAAFAALAWMLADGESVPPRGAPREPRE